MDERRNEDRIQVCLDAVWDGTGTFTARILDLSEGGCFVDTPGETSIGERLTLKVKLPDGNSLELTGEVAHHMRPVGFGLRFDNLTDQQSQQLRSFLDYLRSPHDPVTAVLH